MVISTLVFLRMKEKIIFADTAKICATKITRIAMVLLST